MKSRFVVLSMALECSLGLCHLCKVQVNLKFGAEVFRKGKPGIQCRSCVEDWRA